MAQADAAISNPGQPDHIFLPGYQIIMRKLIKMRVAAGAGKDLHQLGCRFEEIREALGGLIDDLTGDEMRFLRRNADRAVIRMTGAHS